jgi:hypothetical protein
VGFGWNALMKNFVGIGLPIGLALFIALAPTYGLFFGLLRAAMELVDPEFLSFVTLGIEGFAGLIGLAISSYLGGGMAQIALKSARGQVTSFGDVFSGGKYFGSFFVGNLCFSIPYSIGLAVCVAPGVFIFCALFGWQLIIVDQNVGGIDALKKAWDMTNGHRLSIFLYLLIGIGVMIAGYLACGVGALFGSLPILLVGSAYIYLSIKGEPPRLPGN